MFFFKDYSTSLLLLTLKVLTAIANTVLFSDCLFNLISDCRGITNSIIRWVEKIILLMNTFMLNIHMQIFMKFSKLKCVVCVGRGTSLPALV